MIQSRQHTGFATDLRLAVHDMAITVTAKIHSLGTARNYQQSLSMFYRWLQDRKLGDLSTATADQAVDWFNK